MNGGKFSFESDYNFHLFDMQPYHVSASKQQSGLMAGAFQDNGVDFALLPGGPWVHLTDCGCDGGDVNFITPSKLATPSDIMLDEEWGAPAWPWNQSVWNGSQFSHRNPWNIPIGASSSTRPVHPRR